MLNVQVYHEDPDEAQTLRLALFGDGHGGVDVVAVGADGVPCTGGRLLKFSEDGRVTRTPGVSNSLGLQLVEGADELVWLKVD